MKLLNFINIPVFLISLSVGLFFVYITSPKPNVIFVYPNPDNEEKILYKDRSGLCHRFKSTKVKCPRNTSLIRKYPIQGKKKNSS